MFATLRSHPIIAGLGGLAASALTVAALAPTPAAAHATVPVPTAAAAAVIATPIPTPVATVAPRATAAVAPAPTRKVTALTFSGAIAGRMHVTTVQCSVKGTDAQGVEASGTVNGVRWWLFVPENGSGRVFDQELYNRDNVEIYGRFDGVGITHFSVHRGATVNTDLTVLPGGPVAVHVQGTIVCP